MARIQPELDKLIGAKMVARIGEEYEFLTGERRTFEDEVATVAAQLKQQDREAGLAKHFVYDPEKKTNHLPSLLGFETVPFKDAEFEVRVSMDGTLALRNGHIEVRMFSPLAALGGVKVPDLEDQSLRADEQQTIFVLCDRIPGFDQDLNRFLAMREVVQRVEGRPAQVRGGAQAGGRAGDQRPRQARAEGPGRHQDGHPAGARHLPWLEPRAVAALGPDARRDVARRTRDLLADALPEVREGAGADRAGAEGDPRRPQWREEPCPRRQGASSIRQVWRARPALAPARRDRGSSWRAARARRSGRWAKNLLDEFSAPPYGWDRNAVRVGVAACVRAGSDQGADRQDAAHQPRRPGAAEGAPRQP